MRVKLSALMLASVLAVCTGCSICAPGYLDDYGAVGGKWERDNSTQGRVGSILSDPQYSIHPSNDEYTEETYYEMGDGEYAEDEEVYYEETMMNSPSDSEAIILSNEW